MTAPLRTRPACTGGGPRPGPDRRSAERRPGVSDSAARLRAGSWFSRHWGVEAGYTDLGFVEQSYIDGVLHGDSRSIHLSGLGIDDAVNQTLAVTIGAGPMGKAGDESSVGCAGIGLRWQF